MDIKNLEPGWYYILCADKTTRIGYYNGQFWLHGWWYNIITVIAPVPSYEEFKKSNKVLGGL